MMNRLQLFIYLIYIWNVLFCKSTTLAPNELQALEDIYYNTNGLQWQWSNKTGAGIPWNFTNPQPCNSTDSFYWQGLLCSIDISNTDRSFGAMLSGEIAKRFGHKGLSEDSIHINLKGTAGQSFGAFLAKGITLNLEGEGNDYVGKGLSGGRITIIPFKNSKYEFDKNIIVGNTVLYGAIDGECYFSGVAGERFAVRNSGAVAIVEGTGDHCCEYMTGGIVMVLGKTGVNFAAGMSGGIAYVFDENNEFEKNCNKAMVQVSRVIFSKKTDTNNIFDKSSLLDRDELRIKMMLRRHINYTNSKKAKNILENFDLNLKNFYKVFPLDFRKALEQSIKSKNKKSKKVL